MPAPADVSALIEAFAKLPKGEGFTAREIAEAFKISVPTVAQWLAAAVMRGHRFTEVEVRRYTRGRKAVAFRYIGRVP